VSGRLAIRGSPAEAPRATLLNTIFERREAFSPRTVAERWRQAGKCRWGPPRSAGPEQGKEKGLELEPELGAERSMSSTGEEH